MAIRRNVCCSSTMASSIRSRSRDGRTIHRETRRDRAGKVIAQVEGEVRYVLGSGSHARAFLIERDDYLFQSPITWYSQESAGLAPGMRTGSAGSNGKSRPPA